MISGSSTRSICATVAGSRLPRHRSSQIRPDWSQAPPGPQSQDYHPAMYSLREPLPSDVIAHASGPFGGYSRFPVFSAPWLKGRCTVFIPLTAGMGVVEATLIGMVFQDTRLGLETAAVSIPIWVVIGSAGPILATFA